jgi:hypothetical protein
MMTNLRSGFEQSGLHLRHWHGAGAAASALIEVEKLKKHYGLDIAAVNISPQQEAAHHAYFGGRIELPKQGYVELATLHVYDVASAYPRGNGRLAQSRRRKVDQSARQRDSGRFASGTPQGY